MRSCLDKLWLFLREINFMLFGVLFTDMVASFLRSLDLLLSPTLFCNFALLYLWSLSCLILIPLPLTSPQYEAQRKTWPINFEGPLGIDCFSSFSSSFLFSVTWFHLRRLLFTSFALFSFFVGIFLVSWECPNYPL